MAEQEPVDVAEGVQTEASGEGSGGRLLWRSRVWQLARWCPTLRSCHGLFWSEVRVAGGVRVG